MMGPLTLAETFSCLSGNEPYSLPILTGEQRLHYAVLFFALRDIIKDDSSPRRRTDSLAWVFDMPPYDGVYCKHIFSFSAICDTLEVDGDNIRTLLKNR